MPPERPTDESQDERKALAERRADADAVTARQRTQALTRERTLLRAPIAATRALLDSADIMISSLKESDHKKEFSRVTNGRDYMREVVALNDLFERIFSNFSIIASAMGNQPLALEDGKRRFDLTEANMANINTKLAMALRHLAQMRQTPNLPPSKDPRGVEAHMVLFLQDLNRDPEVFDNPRILSKALTVLNDFLTSFIQATGLGIASTIVGTEQRIGELQAATGSLKKQKDEAELMGEEPDEEMKQTWNDILREMQFALAHFYVSMQEIHGPRAAWLLKQVEVDALRKMYQEALRSETTLKKQLSGPPEEEGNVWERMAQALTALVTTRQEPPIPDRRVQKATLATQQEQRAKLLNALKKRMKMEE